MKPRFVTYLFYLLLCAAAVFACPSEAQAQRARKHRGELVTDSVQAQKRSERQARRDSIRAAKEYQEMILSMEAPVDTAALAMKSDSAMAKQPMPKKKWIPDSQKSLWLAMVIPGAGQIYNRKYWKLPIIYGGFVGCAYALTWNSKMYKDYSQAYQDIMSDNPNNDSYMDFLPPYIDINQDRKRWEEKFRKGKDLYRRQRDLSIFAFIGVYLLSVIDAYVDAELSDFDITKDLGMTLEPAIFNDMHRGRPQGVGVQCSFKF